MRAARSGTEWGPSRQYLFAMHIIHRTRLTVKMAVDGMRPRGHQTQNSGAPGSSLLRVNPFRPQHRRPMSAL